MKLPKVPKISNVECMSASQINKNLERVDAASSKLTQMFIDEGRGHERPTDTLLKSDPLAQRYKALQSVRSDLQIEVQLRAGPREYRLPSGRGFGPIKGRCQR